MTLIVSAENVGGFFPSVLLAGACNMLAKALLPTYLVNCRALRQRA